MAGTENFNALVNAPGEGLRSNWPQVTLDNAEAFGAFVHQQADRLLWYSGGINPDTRESLASFSEGTAQTAINIFLREVIGRVARAELSGIASEKLEELTGIRIRFIETPEAVDVPNYGNIALIEFGSGSDDPIHFARFDGNIHEKGFQYGLNVREIKDTSGSREGVRQVLASKLVSLDNLEESDISSGMLDTAKDYVENMLGGWEPAMDAPDNEVEQYRAITQFTGTLGKAAESARAREHVVAERAREQEEQAALYTLLVDTLIEGGVAEENRENLNKVALLFGLGEGTIRISSSGTYRTVVRQGRNREKIKIYEPRTMSVEDLEAVENIGIRVIRPGTESVELRINAGAIEFVYDLKQHEVHIKDLKPEDERIALQILAKFAGISELRLRDLLLEIYNIRFGTPALPVRREVKPASPERIGPRVEIRLVAYNFDDIPQTMENRLRMAGGNSAINLKDLKGERLVRDLSAGLLRKFISDDEAREILVHGIQADQFRELIQQARGKFLDTYERVQREAGIIADEIIKQAGQKKDRSRMFIYVPEQIQGFVEDAVRQKMQTMQKDGKRVGLTLGRTQKLSEDERYSAAYPAERADNWRRRYDTARIMEEYIPYLLELEGTDELLHILHVENVFERLQAGESIEVNEKTYSLNDVDQLMKRYILDDERFARGILVDLFRQVLIPEKERSGGSAEFLDQYLRTFAVQLSPLRLQDSLGMPATEEEMTGVKDKIRELIAAGRIARANEAYIEDSRYYIPLLLLSRVIGVIDNPKNLTKAQIKDMTDVFRLRMTTIQPF